MGLCTVKRILLSAKHSQRADVLLQHAIDVRGELEVVVEELHKVFTRREHTFAVLHDLNGAPVAVRPEGVLHVRPRLETG